MYIKLSTFQAFATQSRSRPECLLFSGPISSGSNSCIYLVASYKTSYNFGNIVSVQFQFSLFFYTVHITLKFLNDSYFAGIMSRKPKIGNLTKVTELYPFLESKFKGNLWWCLMAMKSHENQEFKPFTVIWASFFFCWWQILPGMVRIFQSQYELQYSESCLGSLVGNCFPIEGFAYCAIWTPPWWVEWISANVLQTAGVLTFSDSGSDSGIASLFVCLPRFLFRCYPLTPWKYIFYHNFSPHKNGAHVKVIPRLDGFYWTELASVGHFAWY